MMSVNKQELIERNTSEIVTREELKELLDQGGKPVTYCGYEVSGPVHIGTLVAVSKQLDFQEAGLKVKVLFADLHTYLNRKGDEDFIEEQVGVWTQVFRDFGLDGAEYIRGTGFQYEKEYIHDVLSMGLNTSLLRARRSMQDIARDIENAKVSQMIYPLMQAVDIKALGVDIAHGGMEQRKIHMLSRELLPEIGYKKPVCIHTPLLCSLQGPESKMSSSKPETLIKVDDSERDIKEKINSAYCPKEVEGNPVIEICRYLLFPRYGKLEIKRPLKYGGDVVYQTYGELKNAYETNELHPADLKKAVTEKLIELLEPFR
ncbi:MAG: tyrosine--tRNA ligase [Candidatus Altiarchaeales archaeon ex4484_2]|nr:MAG: tyrosine--tRNA ligase [Candidatus Altiarchaeales archaeon ex4484_2]